MTIFFENHLLIAGGLELFFTRGLSVDCTYYS
jgi:hypothetical protein